MSGRNSEQLLPPGPHFAAACTESADLNEQKQKNDFSFLHTVQFKLPHIGEFHLYITAAQMHYLTRKYQRELTEPHVILI